ncbi:hypothetical protein PR202_gb17303 [Eleusine coracana subsp. coracana]|uniref:Uncharacterized protein n=1 Tax=Eleusine coracana subsp. coracana TaxID=191504 RepID=A0AAV5F3Y2_ELECO|nr:hypothetical protein PR202_gb17303 [Eleusine coracana subsp. coracana]
MDLDADMIPTSPSADSSPSSSDLDTEHHAGDADGRVGVRRPAASIRCNGGGGGGWGGGGPGAARVARRGRRRRRGPGGAACGRRTRRRRRRRGSLGGSWWRLCRDDGGVGVPTSLGEFLDMERQLAGADFLCDGAAGGSGRDPVAAASLFEADGRVRPPQQQQQPAAAEERGRWRLLRAHERSSSLARLPVLLTGICSGGAG